MDTGETVSFTCDPNAKGTALKITIKDRREVLTLCEVLVFGTGMTCSKFCLAHSGVYIHCILGSMRI